MEPKLANRRWDVAGRSDYTTTLDSSFVLTSAATRSWARWVELNSNCLDLDYTSIQMQVSIFSFCFMRAVYAIRRMAPFQNVLFYIAVKKKKNKRLL